MDETQELKQTIETIKGNGVTVEYVDDEKPKKKRVEKEPEPIVEEPKEDRSEFNCTECKGEGITFEHPHTEGRICSYCGGTGKKH